ncbi:DNA internalization-related competence protein ComEC/Rec2 [Candidatus Syntrophocurvum alkaliphilum]|uniref:DNA internalization-related competence protein ComEC/Rec2 n=1 Tax=Candidatus Syntrophocurvum alkaliphilum TaxID=2293317 RepID=A0A6I6DCQ4_9FIRM|nr:DNA internalization-related competence protein ComEC/Rec2 [Candidatus Syntrophocurvum alkaliphilum]QGU00010.1 DNA internalization-related competence protein ComEC/Rec2 [Candidatus Syntrophocurvum alkaliphilum]
MVPIWFASFIVFALSIILSSFFGFKALIAVVIIYLVLLLKPFKSIRIALILVFVVGTFYYNLTTVDPPENLAPIENATLTGKVDTHPIINEDRTIFFINTNHDSPYLQRFRVVCYFPTEVGKGDTVKLKADLNSPNPPTNPGNFDYPRFLKHENVFYIAAVEKPSDIVVIQNNSGYQEIVHNFRTESQEFIKDILPEQQSSVMLGMLLGMRHELPAEQYEDFQKTGIVHIFAVSGLHIGFILLISIWITSLFNLAPGLRVFITIAVMFFYCSVVGWPISVTRAFIMGSIGLIAYYSKSDNSLLNAWGLAGILIMVMDIYSIFKISFQLSFLATFGLIYIFPLIRQAINKDSKIIDLLLVPLCAQIAVLPLVAYYFNLFTPIALLSNIFISYLTGATVILGFLGIVIAPLFQTMASIFVYPAGLCIEIILYMVDVFKGIPNAFSRVSSPSVLAVLLYYVGLLVIARGLIRSNKKVLASGLLVISLFIGSFYIPPSVQNKGVLEVVFIDVGQGDSILIKSPGGKFIIVDGGGSHFSDVASYTVLPYLYDRGVSELFMAINTHPHIDHLKGLESVVSTVPVEYIGLPKKLVDVEEYNFIKETAKTNRISVVPLTRGMVLNIEEDFNIKVLHPGLEDFINSEYNNQSVVLHLKYKGFSMLLTGDIEREAIEVLLRQEQLPSVIATQVPHHGSNTSAVAEFYETINPVYGVISVGENNRFNHPGQATLDVLEQKNINVYRTDKNGAIKFKIDGNTLEIETFITNMEKNAINY